MAVADNGYAEEDEFFFFLSELVVAVNDVEGFVLGFDEDDDGGLLRDREEEERPRISCASSMVVPAFLLFLDEDDADEECLRRSSDADAGLLFELADDFDFLEVPVFPLSLGFDADAEEDEGRREDSFLDFLLLPESLRFAPTETAIS